MIPIRPIPAKQILAPIKGTKPEPYFGLWYNMNLYRGCQHGCIYCDTRSACYGIGDLSDLRYKDRALDLLHRDLGRIRVPGTVGTGSMNDPYMPIEARMNLTRGALKLLIQHAFPVHIITKGTLVYRDTDLLQDLGRIFSAVTLTITTPKDALSRKIEPGAPPSSSRLKTLRLLREKGILAGVIITPILPWITDDLQDLKDLLQACQEAGAAYVLFWPGMTIREGQREYFYQQLDRNFPAARKQYQEKYGLAYQIPSPRARILEEKARRWMSDLGLSSRMPFYQPSPLDNPTQGELF